MDNIFLLILIGFTIGTLGTIIGAGGGFMLVPLLLLTMPSLSPDIVTAVSIAVVAGNAISGSIAYARKGRIDYRAGLVFAAFSLPGAIYGVKLIKYIPKEAFSLAFGILLLVLAVWLFIKNRSKAAPLTPYDKSGGGWVKTALTDKNNHHYSYSYNAVLGSAISLIVGFISPLLGIGGGIIHVPAMVQWLRFPVHVATATSHFVLGIMALASVIVHISQGSYNAQETLLLTGGLLLGVIPGAQLGAFLSQRINTSVIIRLLAVCLAIVGLRIFLNGL